MRLSENIIELERAYALIMEDVNAQVIRHDDGTRRIRLDLQCSRNRSCLPRIVPTYTPQSTVTSQENKAALLLLSAFEATYHGSITPISPDMVPPVIDTGASITVTPYKTDFVTPICPVQHVEIKGIASGLQVSGFSNVSYSFINDNGGTQTMVIKDCLYVPQCTARLLCPRQIGLQSGYPGDSFNALANDPVFTFQGHKTTILHQEWSASNDIVPT